MALWWTGTILFSEFVFLKILMKIIIFLNLGTNNKTCQFRSLFNSCLVRRSIDTVASNVRLFRRPTVAYENTIQMASKLNSNFEEKTKNEPSFGALLNLATLIQSTTLYWEYYRQRFFVSNRTKKRKTIHNENLHAEKKFQSSFKTKWFMSSFLYKIIRKKKLSYPLLVYVVLLKTDMIPFELKKFIKNNLKWHIRY